MSRLDLFSRLFSLFFLCLSITWTTTGSLSLATAEATRVDSPNLAVMSLRRRDNRSLVTYVVTLVKLFIPQTYGQTRTDYVS